MVKIDYFNRFQLFLLFQDGAERIEVLKSRIKDAHDTIQLNRKQANAAKERRKKAERAIRICNAKVNYPNCKMSVHSINHSPPKRPCFPTG